MGREFPWPKWRSSGPVHMKRSIHDATCRHRVRSRNILGQPGCTKAEAIYLDDTGHMSGVDPLFGLAWRSVDADPPMPLAIVQERPKPASSS
jgi:hypothetical protein